MEDILLKWIAFVEDWKKTHTQEINGKQQFFKPQFYDFMEWLINNYK